MIKFDYNPKDDNDKKASMKYLFLARFAKEGRTLEAAYNAWSTLTFDPNKDDIEQFVSKVEDLAKKLGYNEDAQVMAVKSVLPRDVYGMYDLQETDRVKNLFDRTVFKSKDERSCTWISQCIQ